MSKNLAVCGNFGGNNPDQQRFKGLLLVALQPFGINDISLNNSNRGELIFIFIGEVDDSDVDAVHLAIEAVIKTLGGTYHYPDN